MIIAAYLILGWYIFVAGWLFKTWSRYAAQDTTMTTNQQIVSWCMLLIATAFWGITLPLTYQELLKKHSAANAKSSESPLEQSLSNTL
jgi:hypothetical protein